MNRILVVGVPRSGTTWVAKMLAATPQSLALLEPDNPRANPDAGASQRLYGTVPVLHPGDSAPEYERLWDAAFNGRWSYLAPDQPAPRPRGRLRLPESRNLIVKSVFAAFAMDWLTERYRPRVILIERNPVNVVASWMDVGIHMSGLGKRENVRTEYVERLDLPRWDEKAPRLVQAAWAVGVLMTVMRLQARAHGEWRTVSHEELCMDPPVEIGHLARSVGLRWSLRAKLSVRASNLPGRGYQTRRVAQRLPSRWRSLPGADLQAVMQVLSRFPELASWLDSLER